jgi:integrase
VDAASRVRGRIETVIDYAKARKWFVGENPARWKGHLDQLLPRPSRIKPVQHQPAMPWRDVPAFYARLARDSDTSALALRYAILTALRTGAVRVATADEINQAERLHVIPAGRTGATNRGQPLRVPLSDEVRAILAECEARRTSHYLFGGARAGKPISEMALTVKLHALVPKVTVHGFRSSFRDWAADNAVPREVAEACLGHAVANRVETAYARSDLLARRREVMRSWATFVAGEVPVKSEEAARRAG